MVLFESIRKLCLGPLWVMLAMLCVAARPDAAAGDTYTNSIGMQFVQISAGTFTMGVGTTPLPVELSGGEAHRINGDFDEHPNHSVTIGDAYYMGICEVTNAQYELFDPCHATLRGKLGFSSEDDEAVIFVSWNDANSFCQWLSDLEEQPYRLPTEAEWEYACRAGTTTHFFTGDSLPVEYHKNQIESWYPDPERVDNFPEDYEHELVPLTVGQTPANPWGLYDMHGNVEEWCYDWYGPYEDGAQTDPIGRVSGNFRVSRGGSHATKIYYLRSANRIGTLPEDKSWLIGFRVVLGELPTTAPLPSPAPELYQQDVNQAVPPDINDGPDPTQPYFEVPRKYVKITSGSTGPLFSNHNHDPALMECPNGDLLAIWYTTVSERGRELALAASRLRYGQAEWDDASPFWDGPDRNDHAPAAWYNGSGKLYQFVGLSAAATWGNMAILLRTSTDNGVTWSAADIIVSEHETRHQPVESVFRTSWGSIILPCDATSRGDGGTAIHVSDDNGLTWTDLGLGQPKPTFAEGQTGAWIAGIHAGIVELNDGRLLAFGRGDSIGNMMPKSISTDMGQNWTYSASTFPPIGSGKRLALTRLTEGPLFLAAFATSMVMTDGTGVPNSCSGLYGAVSFDEGETWPVIRLVSNASGEQVEGTDGVLFTMSATNAEPKGYLSVCQTPDDVIQLISSRQHYAFNLTWLKDIIVDDFESYSSSSDLTSTWQYNAAAILSLETGIVHEGEQAMRVLYYNGDISPYYSEAERTYEPAQDWAVRGFKALTLFFYGDGGNNANEPMYVALGDGDVNAVVVYGDSGEDTNDLKVAQWHEWNIDLQDFNDGGVDLTNIKKVFIGFGDRDDPQVGSSGVVYFDDIRPYPPRCIGEYGPAADFTGDCVVDFNDLKIMTDEWLLSGQLEADLYEDNKVDFKDFAILASMWFEEQLWP